MDHPNTVTKEHFFNYVNDFMDYRKTIYQVSDQTIKSNHIDLRLFKDFVELNNYHYIDGPAVIEFQYYLKKQRLNSGASINRKIFTLRSYSNFLKLEQVEAAESLPFYNVLKIRQGYRQRPQALAKDQIKQLFDSIDRSNFLGLRDYAIYGLMYGLGLRVGEVHQLDLQQLNLTRKTITVTGKGNKQRTLYLTTEMIDILSEWLAVRHNFMNSKKNNALFISKKGHRLAIRTMEDNFQKIIKKAKLTTHFTVVCHTLRHSFASHLNDNETDILVIQSLLGHSSPRSTQIYIHPSEQRVREALEKLPCVIYMNQLIESGNLKLKFQSRYNK